MQNSKITFENIQNHFGDRGIELLDGAFKLWQVDNNYIYWIPNNEILRETGADELCADSDTSDQILWCAKKSMCIEVQDAVWSNGNEDDLAQAVHERLKGQ